MKASSLFFLLMIAGCSSNAPQVDNSPFQKEIVCSRESLNYLKKYKPLPAGEAKYSDAEIQEKMLKLMPPIRSCYEEEMARTNIYRNYDLCFVVGFTSKSKIEFFEFSTNEKPFTAEFKECLAKLKNHDELKGFKNLSITQPFRLYPKPSGL